MVKAFLFDVYNTLIRESKDVSQYYTEAIRAIYGLNIEGMDLKEYEGKTTQETITEMLAKAGLPQQEIDKGMAQFMEQLPYDHYNVAGHDFAVLMDGAHDVLKTLNANSNFAVGICTGMLERIVRNMFERVQMNVDSFAKFGVYGNAGKDYRSIIDQAAKQAAALGAQQGETLMVSSSKYAMSAASDEGIWAVGVATGRYSQEELKDAGANLVVKNLKDVLKAAQAH